MIDKATRIWKMNFKIINMFSLLIALIVQYTVKISDQNPYQLTGLLIYPYILIVACH